jgi:glucose/arabinose dehydrogenase
MAVAFGAMHRTVVLLLVAIASGLAACNQPAQPSVTPSSSASAAGSPAASPSEEPPTSPSPSPSAGGASGEPPRLELEPVLDGLSDPVDIAWRPDDPDTLFVVEQVGRVRIVRDGRLVERPFLDISGLVRAGGESGLLGLAFLPSGEHGRFFVYYTARADGNQVVASYDTNPDDRDVAAPGTAQVWLRMDDPFGNHNGGSTVFGPDGFLYIGTGDGGGGGDPLGSGRSLDTLLAKVLRIDVGGDPGDGEPAYAIPPDNPFVDTADARPEIWHTGLRNPWRMRFDRATGDLWIGDVGQGSLEEIDVARAGTGGLDYGWNVMEGTSCFRSGGDDCATPDLTLPVTEYDHDFGCSVTGGTVYRGASLPALQGWYVFSDYCSGIFWAIHASQDSVDTPTIVAESDLSISAIAEDAAGELFATDLSSGALLHIGLAGG